MNQQATRFAEKYGDIIGTATNGLLEAPVGYISSTNSYLVFYPDNKMERFEECNLQVTYRTGYTGPELKYQSDSDKKQARDEREIAREERKAARVAKLATRTPRTKRIGNVKEVIWERQRGFKKMEVPQELEDFIDKAKVAFNQAVAALHDEQKVYDTANSAFWGIVDCGYLTTVSSNFTDEDVAKLKDLPTQYHLYIGAHYVGQ